MKFPQHLITVAEDYEVSGGRAILIVLEFDPTKITYEKMALESPSWAQPFIQTCAKGVIGIIMDGNKLSMDQLRYICGVFDQERIVNPLSKFHGFGKRFVFKRDKLEVPTFSPGETYQFDNRLSYNDAAEWLTFVCIAAIKEDDNRKALIFQFEAASHEIKVVSIEGTNHNTYLALLPIPAKIPIRLQAGDKLHITFLDPATNLLKLQASSPASGPVPQKSAEDMESDRLIALHEAAEDPQRPWTATVITTPSFAPPT